MLISNICCMQRSITDFVQSRNLRWAIDLPIQFNKSDCSRETKGSCHGYCYDWNLLLKPVYIPLAVNGRTREHTLCNNCNAQHSITILISSLYNILQSFSGINFAEFDKEISQSKLSQILTKNAKIRTVSCHKKFSPLKQSMIFNKMTAI